MSNSSTKSFLKGDFFELSDNVIAVIDNTGCIKEINSACTAIVGYRPEELVGKSVYNFAHPDDLHNVSAELNQIDNITTSIQAEYRWCCKDGSWKSLCWDIQLIPEEKVIFVIGREISSNGTTEKSLEEATNTLNSVIESIPAMIFMKSAADLRFVRFNRGGENLLGISREDLLGKSDYDLFTKEQADFFAEKDRAVLGSHDVLDILEEPIQTSSGETLYLRTSKVALRDVNGTPTHLLGISIDITDRRNAELELRRVNAELSTSRAEAEQANQAKSEFLAKMSHEIRTPMNGVIGMADVLRESNLDENQVEMVELIQNSALSLLRIIDDILDFSKIEAGQLEIDIHPFSVVESVESVCAMLNSLALNKNVALSVFADPNIPNLIMGDSLRLRQVFINLINNAIKFSSNENQVGRVSVRATILEKYPTQIVIEFLIEDDGIGMDEATQARLFTPFMQKDSAISRDYGGTGLGLVITQSLVKLMGGDIFVQSQLHQGSSFKIHIPFAVAPTTILEEHKPSEVNGLLCLLIDAGGEQSNTSDLAAYLEHAGAKVERAANVSAAVVWEKNSGNSGTYLWIIDTEATFSAKKKLYQDLALKRGASDDKPIVIIQRGIQCEPASSLNLVSVDGNAMSQHSFLRIVAQVARQLKTEPERLVQEPSLKSNTASSRSKVLKHNINVLVAEDNKSNQKVLVRQLEILGYKAKVATNGCEALDHWRQGDFDLLLTDLQMPDMDGYELCDAIRAEENDMQRIPVILLTAVVLNDTDSHYSNSDIDDYLSKPARLEDLRQIIEKWLKSKGSE